MRDIADKCGHSTWFSLCSYGDIIASYEYKVLLQVDDADYQGDTRVLFEDANGRIGHMQFGWGSCSGCDALEACDSVEQVRQLQRALHDQIKWFDTTADALNWFKSHDWQGDYSWHHEEQLAYVRKAIALLSSK